MSLLDTPSMRHVIFNALCAHPYGLTVPQLITFVYPDPDKEPDTAADSVRMGIGRANRWFEKMNGPFRIRRSTLGRYALWLRRVRK